MPKNGRFWAFLSFCYTSLPKLEFCQIKQPINHLFLEITAKSRAVAAYNRGETNGLNWDAD
jgi:hypothetical protein